MHKYIPTLLHVYRATFFRKGRNILSPNSEARKRANAKYALKAYDRLEITVKKGRKDDIKAHAAECGESLNGFVNRAINEAIERDKQEGAQ